MISRKEHKARLEQMVELTDAELDAVTGGAPTGSRGRGNTTACFQGEGTCDQPAASNNEALTQAAPGNGRFTINQDFQPGNR